MSLYDDASLIQVPSLYKDGLLVSTVPEDRSGDFVFSRGSNLAATRVNSSGLIEKGYENLLLQSNSFDTTWLQNRIDLTSGQSGYDGGSDAWKLESNNSSTTYLDQSVVASGVQTISLYAKAGTANYLTFYNSSAASVWFNLSNGSLGNTNTNIDTKIKAVGSDGWYRCSMTFNVATSYIRVYVTDVNGSFPSAIGANILIQDAQLESGLVATDVIETTTTTGTAGILEDQPRLDYTNGTPALLLEPSRTNVIEQSEYFGGSYWTKSGANVVSGFTSPEGLSNAYKLVATSNNGFILKQDNPIVANAYYTNSIYLKRVQGVGQVTMRTVNNSIVNITLTNEWQRFEASVISDSSTVFTHQISLATAGDEIMIFGAQCEQGSYPTSLIPTYGTSVTRAADTQSELTIPNGSVTEGTIFYEFDKAQAPTSFDITPFKVGSNRMLRISQYNPNMRFSINENATSYSEPNSYNSHIKVVVSYSSSVVKLFINGNLRATDNTYSGSGSVIVPTYGLQATQLGCSIESKQLLYFPTALSDAECIELTTI